MKGHPLHAMSARGAFDHTLCGRGIRASVTKHAERVTCTRCLAQLKIPGILWGANDFKTR